MQQVPWLAAGRYEVGDVVGKGGYGMVCRGVDRQTGKAVALKMLSPEAGRDPDVVERMLREQQALVALAGTCAVTAIDLCRLESGAPCLVMEWLDGRDLEQQLAEWEDAGQRGSAEQLLAIVQPLAQTLERAHQIGIVHRDIKPANVFLTAGPPPSVRLLDFGLSRMKSAAALTAVGVVMGSPSYIAPETWRGNSAALDGRADLFALAVIVFRFLTGTLPFDAQDLIGKMTAVTSGPRPSAVALRPELPATLDAWLARALAIEPVDRFQTGGDFCAALAAALRGEAWQSDVEASGVRHLVSAKTSTDAKRKNILANAWSAAASLLKHFKPAPVAAAPASTEAKATQAAEPRHSDRPSLWLDSAELEDVVLPKARAASSVSLTAPPVPPRKPPAAPSTTTAKAKATSIKPPPALAKAKATASPSASASAKQRPKRKTKAAAKKRQAKNKTPRRPRKG